MGRWHRYATCTLNKLKERVEICSELVHVVDNLLVITSMNQQLQPQVNIVYCFYLSPLVLHQKSLLILYKTYMYLTSKYIIIAIAIIIFVILLIVAVCYRIQYERNSILHRQKPRHPAENFWSTEAIRFWSKLRSEVNPLRRSVLTSAKIFRISTNLFSILSNSINNADMGKWISLILYSVT